MKSWRGLIRVNRAPFHAEIFFPKKGNSNGRGREAEAVKTLALPIRSRVNKLAHALGAEHARHQREAITARLVALAKSDPLPVRDT